MKCVVGYSPDQGGREALNLGAVIARSSGGSLVVATIVPESWGHPSVARVDAEYARFLGDHAQKSLAKAKQSLGEGIEADYVSRSANSIREGLVAIAQDTGADIIVLGSSRRASIGRFAEGNVASDLLHGAEVNVAVAPRGYAPGPGVRLKRITCAYSGTSTAGTAGSTAYRTAEICQAMKLPLRLATFVVRDKQMYPTGAGYRVENLVSNQLRLSAEAAQAELAESWQPKVKLSAAIGDGKTWKAAMDSLPWQDQELITVGSSDLGPLTRVFLGSNSGKIIHNSPVPSLILTRSIGEAT